MINLDTLEYLVSEYNETTKYSFGELVVKYGWRREFILTPVAWSVYQLYELENSSARAHFHPHSEADVSLALISMLAVSTTITIEAVGMIRGKSYIKIPLKDVWPRLLTSEERRRIVPV